MATTEEQCTLCSKSVAAGERRLLGAETLRNVLSCLLHSLMFRDRMHYLTSVYVLTPPTLHKNVVQEKPDLLSEGGGAGTPEKVYPACYHFIVPAKTSGRGKNC